MKKALALLALVPLVFVGILLGAVVILAPPPDTTACVGGAAVSVGRVPAAVGRWKGPQLAGAAAIMRAGKDAGLPVRGQTIGVMVSMGESGLTPVDHGDKAGPDSLGWFQQRDPWGPRPARLDAYASATMFFTGGRGGQQGLTDIAGWESMTPTAAAHAVQRNADPFYYTKFWDQAVAVVGALAGVPVDVVPGAGNLTCTDLVAGQIPVGAGGWVVPTVGRLSSGFGNRGATGASAAQFHKGQDIAAPCGTPIYAAHDGLVIRAGAATGFGNAIYLDVGGGIVVINGHEFADGVLVKAGQRVKAGQQIGKVGSAGQSTGCHNHLQIEVNRVAVDPVPFMAAHGAPLQTAP